MYGEHDYEVLTSAREGLQRQEDHFGSKQRHDTDGYNIIPFGYCTYRNRSDDGKFAFNINTISEKAIVSKFYPVFRFTNANSTFMAEFLNSSPRVKKKLSVLAVGTSQVVLSFEALKAAKFDLPCKDEQDKIAAFLECLNARIENQRTLVVALKKYKRGLLHDVLSEKIKITTETWTEHRIGEFLHSKSIKQLPTTDAPLMAFTATGGVCDKGERYDRGFLVKNASSKLYKRTDLNDFIYSSNNLDVGSIGLNLYGSAVISDVYEIFSIKDADPWFISEAIKQKPIMSRILKYRQGCLYGQYRIYAEDFLGVFVKIPSYEAQKKIGAVFSKIDGKITQEQILLDCLEKARTFFLQQLFI